MLPNTAAPLYQIGQKVRLTAAGGYTNYLDCAHCGSMNREETHLPEGTRGEIIGIREMPASTDPDMPPDGPWTQMTIAWDGVPDLVGRYSTATTYIEAS